MHKVRAQEIVRTIGLKNKQKEISMKVISFLVLAISVSPAFALEEQSAKIVIMKANPSAVLFQDSSSGLSAELNPMNEETATVLLNLIDRYKDNGRTMKCLAKLYPAGERANLYSIRKCAVMVQ